MSDPVSQIVHEKSANTVSGDAILSLALLLLARAAAGLLWLRLPPLLA